MSYTASVITVSDLGSRGLRQDTSGPAVRAMLEDAGFTVVHTAIVPDERGQISALLRACADEKRIDLILTTGGTGLSPRDVTPEATADVLEREIRAIPVAMWVEGLKITPNARAERPGLGKGGARKSRRRARRAGARPAHDRRRGSRLSRYPQTA